MHVVQKVVYLSCGESLEEAFSAENRDCQLSSARVPRPLYRVVEVVAHGLLDLFVPLLVKVHVAQKVIEEVEDLTSVVIEGQH